MTSSLRHKLSAIRIRVFVRVTFFSRRFTWQLGVVLIEMILHFHSNFDSTFMNFDQHQQNLRGLPKHTNTQTILSRHISNNVIMKKCILFLLCIYVCVNVTNVSGYKVMSLYSININNSVGGTTQLNI